MSAPGFIWMPGASLSSEDVLHSALLSIFGARLVVLGIGADLLLNGSNQVTSWPLRIGGTLTPSATTYPGATINGRRAFGPPASPVGEAFQLNSGVVNTTAILVVECTATVVFAETWESAYSSNATQILMRNLTTANFINATQSTYVDGVLTAAIPTSGVHIFEGHYPGRTHTGVVVGGWTGGDRTPRGKIGLFAAVSDASSEGERASANAAINTYFGA